MTASANNRVMATLNREGASNSRAAANGNRNGVNAAMNDGHERFLKAFPVFSTETVTEVKRRGLFSQPNARSWRYGDKSNGTTRRLPEKKNQKK